MFISLNSLGSMVLDVDGNRLDAKFLDSAGVAADHFTIIKGPSSHTLPAAPMDLTAVAVSSSQINLTWSDNSNNEEGFKIERCQGQNCTDFAEISQDRRNATAFSSIGLSRKTRYSYRVRAFNAAGSSSYSNIAGARTLKR
jgi:hypothetical protein